MHNFKSTFYKHLANKCNSNSMTSLSKLLLHDFCPVVLKASWLAGLAVFRAAAEPVEGLKIRGSASSYLVSIICPPVEIGLTNP